MGGLSARMWALRAALRLARRDAWRNKGRSALIAIMVALPVLAASTVSVLYRSEDRDPQDIVQLTLGDQAQASLSVGLGAAIEQSPDGQDMGSTASEPSTRPKELTLEEFQNQAQALISDRDQIIVSKYSFSNRGIRFNDGLLNANVRELDYAASGLGGLIIQVTGRAPKQDGEVVVSQKLAKYRGIKDGDQLTFAASRESKPKTLDVVGVVRGLSLIGESTVIGPVGSLIPTDKASVASGYVEQNLLVVGPDPVTWDQVLDLNQIGSTVLSRSVVKDPPSADRIPYREGDYGDSGLGTAIGIGAVVIGLVLLQIALLAGPAIAVGARRNQRSLAIMVSAGAEQRHLRAVVLATTGVIGLVSCLVAAALGGALGAVAVLVLRSRFDQQFVRVDLRPLDLLGFALVGGLTALAAALIPARQASRLDVVAALTGRRGQAPPRLRVPLVGLVVAVAGVGLAYFGSQQRQALVTVAGLAMTEIGLVAAAGAIVALAARLAVRLPFAPRFALRDAARQRGRTAPAVAAVLAAIAGGTAALTYISSQSLHDEQTYTPMAALGVVMVSGDEDAVPSDFEAIQGALRRTLPITQVAAYYGPPHGNDGSGTYLGLTPPPQNLCPLSDGTMKALSSEAEMARIQRTDPRCMDAQQEFATMSFQGNDMFDDGTALTIVTGTDDPADTNALKSGKVLVSDPLMMWPDGTVHVEVDRESATTDSEESDDPPATITLPARLSTRTPKLNSPVYPLSAAKALGVTVKPSGLFATTSRMPTSAEEDKAAAAVADTAGGGYLSVERGYQDNYAIGLLALVVASAIVTLGGTFTAVGLAAAEGRADVATLAAVGASPGVRRRLAASQAGVIAGLGGVLGVASGIMAGWILVRLQQNELGVNSIAPTDERWSLELPWTYLLATGLGVPMLAVLIGFLSTRSRLPLVRRLGQ